MWMDVKLCQNDWSPLLRSPLHVSGSLHQVESCKRQGRWSRFLKDVSSRLEKVHAIRRTPRFKRLDSKTTSWPFFHSKCVRKEHVNGLCICLLLIAISYLKAWKDWSETRIKYHLTHIIHGGPVTLLRHASLSSEWPGVNSVGRQNPRWLPLVAEWGPRIWCHALANNIPDSLGTCPVYISLGLPLLSGSLQQISTNSNSARPRILKTSRIIILTIFATQLTAYSTASLWTVSGRHFTPCLPANHGTNWLLSRRNKQSVLSIPQLPPAYHGNINIDVGWHTPKSKLPAISISIRNSIEIAAF